MIEEDAKVDPRHLAPIDQYGESLLYDFAKFLTTLSLLALGGVLTLADTADQADVKTLNIILVTVVIASAGLIAMLTANAIAYARAAGGPSPARLHRFVGASMALLCVGLGMFLFLWMDKLN